MRVSPYLLRVAALVLVAWLSPPALASAADVVGVSYADDDRAVLDHLEAMLDAPIARHEARRRDDPARIAASSDARFVVVVHLSAREMHVYEPGRHRHATRELPPSLAHGSAYTVAGVAYELLELVRTAPDGSPEVSVDVATDRGAGEGRFRHVDGFRLGLGARLTVTPGGDPLLVDLVGTGEVALRAGSRFLFPVGVFVAGLGRDSSDAVVSARTVNVGYRRTDVGFRVGIGHRFDRLLFFAHVVAGPAFVRATTTAAAGGSGTPVNEVDRSTAFFAGLAGEVRYELPRGFALATTAAVDSTFQARDYGAVGLEAFHVAPIRLTFAFALLWGRPTR